MTRPTDIGLVGEMPKHVAIIMDGNGRWAKQQGFGRSKGHREGARRAEEIISACVHNDIRFLTLYAFSAENWNRPLAEVTMLMRFFVQQLRTLDKKLIKNKVALRPSGDLDKLPKFVQWELKRVAKVTACDDPKTTLVVCVSYGGRQEIVSAAKKMALAAQSGEVDLNDVSEEQFGKFLYQPEIPDPDMLIRTGGDVRISNFLLWQLAYSELYFTEKLWPDFHAEDLLKAVHSFRTRERRFGMTSEQLFGSSIPKGMPISPTSV